MSAAGDAAASPVRVRLDPLGKTLELAPGASLQDALFAQGVEFPCGGRGTCKGCRVKLLKGALPPTDTERKALGPAALEEGWRLACQSRVTGDVTLQVAQWESPILADDRAVTFEPQAGLGVAMDLGTTTLVAQLVDLANGRVLAVRTALNPQARHGGDIMSRVEFGSTPEGAETLRHLIRKALGRLLAELVTAVQAEPAQVRRAVLVGNTVMHHLFCGLSVVPLSRYPFETDHLGMQTLTGADVGWSPPDLAVMFLPCFGGFVGSDIVAGVLATGLHEAEALEVLVDLGTNGEMIMGNRRGLHCAATAAGPAFEGARIHKGMRAATGAINAVRAENGGLVCEVIGGGEPRGICGSGLVDAVAAALELESILPSGRMKDGAPYLPLAGAITLSQTDVRQLQLAKGAISAGVQILARRCGVALDAVSRLHLAGAFGNYINVRSARRIGLLPVDSARVAPAGNAALHGAKLALCRRDPAALCAPVLAMTSHLSLSADPEFQDIYVDEMSYPETGG